MPEKKLKDKLATDEDRTQGLQISTSTLYHWATKIPYPKAMSSIPI